MLYYEDTNHLKYTEPGVNMNLNLTHTETNFNFAVGLYSKAWDQQEIDSTGYIELSIALS